MYRRIVSCYMKKLSVYLYSTEEADSQNATLIRLYDCGNSGERYEQALKFLDADEEAIKKYVSDLFGEGVEPDVDFECFHFGPGSVARGYKIDVNVRDEEKDKDVHTSTLTFKDTPDLLLEHIDDLAFSEDFPPLLEKNIREAIAKVKAENNEKTLKWKVAQCASYFPMNLYRSENPEVTDDNVYIGVVRHLEMDNVAFEIQLDDNEKFDKKKIFLFEFTIKFPNLHYNSSYITIYAVPLLLYGNTLYYGGLGDWSYEEELYGLFKFSETPDDHTFKITRAGFGRPLINAKPKFVGE